MASEKSTAQLLGLLSQLNLQSSGDQRGNLLQQLIDGLARDGIDRGACTQKLVEEKILVSLQAILSSSDSTERCKAAELVAELAKAESVRESCVQSDLIPPLVAMLTNTDVNTSTQSCRALGNICFDNDDGRQVVEKNGGMENLLQLLKSQLGASGPGCEKLRMVACGFLLNLTNTHESIQEKAVSLGAVEVLKSYLEQHSDEEGCCHMALLGLGSLSESDPGRERIEKSGVVTIVAGLLGTQTGEELQDTILDLLGTLAESEGVKTQLAQCGVCDQLLEISQAPDEDEDSQHAQKLASDLIVLLLTGEKSMDLLYGGGKTSTYKRIIGWLDSRSEQLQMSGALAVGNFARNDEHCRQLVKDGATEKLLQLLQQPSENVSVTLQHAIFSALRNMAIPASNKAVMLRANLLQTVLPYASTDMSPVQFKLLGLLRMVIDSQEEASTKLGTNEEFLPRLVSFCAINDHAGVKGEASRLLAWLIKHSRSPKVMCQVIQSGGVPHLVTMVTSEHAVMQNEALVALSLIATSVLDEASEALLSAGLLGILKDTLTLAETLPEILSNVLTLLSLLTPSGVVKNKLKEEGFVTVVDKMTKHEEEMVKEQAKKAKQALIT